MIKFIILICSFLITGILLIVYVFQLFNIKKITKRANGLLLKLSNNNSYRFLAYGSVYIVLYCMHPYLKNNVYMLIYAILFICIGIINQQIKTIVTQDGIFDGASFYTNSEVRFTIQKNKLIVLCSEKVIFKFKLIKKKEASIIAYMQRYYTEKIEQVSESQKDTVKNDE